MLCFGLCFIMLCYVGTDGGGKEDEKKRKKTHTLNSVFFLLSFAPMSNFLFLFFCGVGGSAFCVLRSAFFISMRLCLLYSYASSPSLCLCIFIFLLFFKYPAGREGGAFV